MVFPKKQTKKYLVLMALQNGKSNNHSVGDPDTERRNDESLHFGRAGFPKKMSYK